MGRRRSALTWAVAFSPVVLAGCASGEVVVDKEWEIPPGRFVEANLDMRQGAVVNVTIRAAGPVEWDVHSHGEDGTVTVHHRGNASAVLDFIAPSTNTFSVFVQNPSAEASLDVGVVIRGDARVRSIVP